MPDEGRPVGGGLLADTRGSATGTSNFLLALFAGAILAWVLKTIAEPFIARAEADAAGDPTGTQAIAVASTVVDYWPMLVIFTAFFSYLALAVFQSSLAR